MTTAPAVRLEEAPAIPLAVVRRQVRQADLSREVPNGCGVVWKVIREHGLKAGRNVALYWDGSIRLEVGVELDGPFAGAGEVVRSATPAGLVATATHFGPYGTLGTAHQAVVAFCAAHHHRLLGPSWEIYGHWQDEWNRDPSRIRTDVYYQVAPAA